MTTATQEGAGAATGLAIPASVTVKAVDRPLLRLAAVMVKNAAKNAARLNKGLDIVEWAAQERITQADAILAVIDDLDHTDDVAIRGDLLRCAQIGLLFQLRQVAKEKKTLQVKLQIADTKNVDKRAGALERLARELGYQGEFSFDEDEEKEEAEE